MTKIINLPGNKPLFWQINAILEPKIFKKSVKIGGFLLLYAFLQFSPTFVLNKNSIKNCSLFFHYLYKSSPCFLKVFPNCFLAPCFSSLICSVVFCGIFKPFSALYLYICRVYSFFPKRMIVCILFSLLYSKLGYLLYCIGSL